MPPQTCQLSRHQPLYHRGTWSNIFIVRGLDKIKDYNLPVMDHHLRLYEGGPRPADLREVIVDAEVKPGLYLIPQPRELSEPSLKSLSRLVPRSSVKLEIVPGP